MGKIKQFFTAKSIKKDYITFTCLSILTALIISVICSGLLQNAQHAILGKYEDYYDYQNIPLHFMAPATNKHFTSII